MLKLYLSILQFLILEHSVNAEINRIRMKGEITKDNGTYVRNDTMFHNVTMKFTFINDSKITREMYFLGDLWHENFILPKYFDFSNVIYYTGVQVVTLQPGDSLIKFSHLVTSIRNSVNHKMKFEFIPITDLRSIPSRIEYAKMVSIKKKNRRSIINCWVKI